MGCMAKAKRYFYLLDNVDEEKRDIIEKGLKAIDSVTGVHVELTERVLEVSSTIKPDTHVQMACEVAGTIVRTKLKKRYVH